MRKARLDRMTWPEVQQASEHKLPVLIPLGTVETQGIYVPMGSDALVVDSLADQVGQRTECVVVPTVPFGYSHFSKSFPGTISLRPQTLHNILLDIMTSLIDHGFDHLLVLNNHGQQEAIVGQVCDIVRERYGIFVASIFPSRLARDLCADLFDEGARAFRHGGAATLSRLLYLAPDDIVMDQLAEVEAQDQFRGLPLTNPLQVQFAGSTATLYVDIEQTLPTGGYDGVSRASAEKGAIMMERMAVYLVQFLGWFRNIDTLVKS